MGEAVLIGDYDRVIKLITQVVDCDAKLAQALSRLAEQFDSMRLLQLIEAQKKPNT